MSLEHVHLYGPDLYGAGPPMCICGATPIDTIEELYAEARRERDEARERADKAEALLRAVAFDDRHKLQAWLEPLYVREPYVKVLVDKATELLSIGER